MENLIGRMLAEDGRETVARPQEGHDTTIQRFAVDESLTIFIPFYLPSSSPPVAPAEHIEGQFPRGQRAVTNIPS